MDYRKVICEAKIYRNAVKLINCNLCGFSDYIREILKDLSGSDIHDEYLFNLLSEKYNQDSLSRFHMVMIYSDQDIDMQPEYIGEFVVHNGEVILKNIGDSHEGIGYINIRSGEFMNYAQSEELLGCNDFQEEL